MAVFGKIDGADLSAVADGVEVDLLRAGERQHVVDIAVQRFGGKDDIPAEIMHKAEDMVVAVLAVELGDIRHDLALVHLVAVAGIVQIGKLRLRGLLRESADIVDAGAVWVAGQHPVEVDGAFADRVRQVVGLAHRQRADADSHLGDIVEGFPQDIGDVDAPDLFGTVFRVQVQAG